MEARSQGGGGDWRRKSPSSSPEFEFWMLGNPSLPPAQLLSADELFVDGVLLPLHLVSQEPADPTPPKEHTSTATTTAVDSDTCPAAVSSAPVSSSKRWTDIFRVGSGDREKEREKEKKKKRKQGREKKGSAGAVPVLVPSAEQININIWPFSRSRSAGSRQRSSHSTGRKVSSAPCSRSNSGGGRGGIPVGRASPVWQAPKKRNGVGVAGLPKLNVDGCIGHRQQMGGCGHGHHFSLRGLFFPKKVY